MVQTKIIKQWRPPLSNPGLHSGSVVTARFVTREVHVVASVDVLGADGTLETITGTTIHPVWSVDRQEWVPLAELGQGETLQGLDAPHRVPGTDLGSLFASIQPGALPGAWHRFGDLFASIQPGAAPGAWHRFGAPIC